MTAALVLESSALWCDQIWKPPDRTPRKRLQSSTKIHMTSQGFIPFPSFVTFSFICHRTTWSISTEYTGPKPTKCWSFHTIFCCLCSFLTHFYRWKKTSSPHQHLESFSSPNSVPVASHRVLLCGPIVRRFVRRGADKSGFPRAAATDDQDLQAMEGGETIPTRWGYKWDSYK